MIYGETDVSTRECEIVYACVFSNGRPSYILVGHIEIEHARAEGKRFPYNDNDDVSFLIFQTLMLGRFKTR